MYQDETLTCRDCGEDFIFTARDQEFFAEKGFTNKPVRCKSCRIARKGDSFGGGAGGGRRQDRQMYEATCAQCGKPAQVPFVPKNDRPVYCSDCFTRNR